MGSTFGWYGPLIDLSTASSHVDLKIVKYGNVVEARTVQWSSLLCLVHPYQSLLSKAVEELITGCRVGTTTKDKLRRVIKWVQQSRSTICNIKTLGDNKKEKVFISRRVCRTEDNNLVDDLLCTTGCQLCGSPLDSKYYLYNYFSLLLVPSIMISDNSSPSFRFEQNAVPLICWKTSSRLHSICWIYRPFLLYVWDESDYMPILVKNRAEEILFGNIKTGKVYSAYKEQTQNQNLGPSNECKDKDASERLAINPRPSGEGLPSANTLDVGKSLQLQEKHLPDKFNFYCVWLILLKMLLKQGKNGPLKFEIIVGPSLDIENGNFERVSATMPCFGTK
ncbi:hypothetical protein JHK82_035643 [Glycine max]|nr:hypothetical protein JHK85_036369 [Glycine max]KAG4976302.1 hypothetical protein JHK86_035776 [Glycine max]KAG5112374.1 hypothetical protein JHK82_035643 [Glycine max]